MQWCKAYLVDIVTYLFCFSLYTRTHTHTHIYHSNPKEYLTKRRKKLKRPTLIKLWKKVSSYISYRYVGQLLKRVPNNIMIVTA